MACCYGAAFFVDMVNTRGESCTASYLVDQVMKTVEQHNLAKKIVAFVSDTPSTNKAMWEQLAAVGGAVTLGAGWDGCWAWMGSGGWWE